MANRSSERRGATEWMETAQNFMSMNPMLSAAVPQMQQFWTAQDQILSDFEDLSRAWFQRRHEASRKGLEAAKSLGTNGETDISHAMEVMNDWLTNSVARLADDARDNYEFCMRCTNHLTAGTMDAAQTGAQASKQAARKSTDTKKTASGDA